MKITVNWQKPARGIYCLAGLPLLLIARGLIRWRLRKRPPHSRDAANDTNNAKSYS